MIDLHERLVSIVWDRTFYWVESSTPQPVGCAIMHVRLNAWDQADSQVRIAAQARVRSALKPAMMERLKALADE